MRKLLTTIVIGLRTCLLIDWPSKKNLSNNVILILLIGISTLLLQFSDVLADGCETKYEGVQYCTEGETHYLLVDLQNPYVRVQTVIANDSNSVNPSPDSRETVKSIGERYKQSGAVAVINADYFGSGHGPEGLTVRNGARLDGEANGDCDHNPKAPPNDTCGDNGIYRSALAILNSKVAVVGKNLWGSYGGNITNAVGGGPKILNSGQVIPIGQACSDEGFTDSRVCTNATKSQTFAGTNSGGNTLLLGVSANMSVDGVAQFMKNHNMKDGLKFDGGGSSTMWYDGKLVYNAESRAVADALVVFSVPFYTKDFNVSIPWWYTFFTCDSGDIQVSLDGEELFTASSSGWPGRARTKFVGRGSHQLKVVYSNTVDGRAPNVEFRTYNPVVRIACAGGSETPPPPPPTTEPQPPPNSTPPPPATSNSATFLSDITLPDGSVVSPGQALVKTWRVKNTGTSTWNGYKLKFTGGEQMGGPAEVAIPTTAPGATVDLSINLTAPTVAGAHSGVWRIVKPDGTWVSGGQLWLKINVVAPNPGGSKITMFDISPPSPSQAASVHVVARAKYFPEFRSMRFVLGGEVKEMTNFQQVGDEVEISADWDTATLPRGNYALIVEVAGNDDPNWTNTERQVRTYTLIGTPASTNRAPERPILKSPYDWYLKDAAGASAPVQMCVYPANDPDGDTVRYWFELNNGAVTSGWTTNTCWEPTLSPGHYTWRVKAGDGTDESDWSQGTWHFSVASGGVSIDGIYFYAVNTNETHICVPVSYGGIIAPEVRAFINGASDGSENGPWYQLDHYGPNTTPDCTQPNYHGFWIRSLHYTTGNHVIRVNAHKGDSGASATRTANYNIAYLKPPTPVVVAPATPDNNGTWWNNPTITFRWQEPLRANSYRLRVSTNSDIWNDPSPLLDRSLPAGTTSYTHTFNQDYDKLYWGVQASNSAGSSQSAGGVWFGIDRVPPTCSVQPLAATTYENVFQVNWSGTDSPAGIRSFDIQFLDSGRDAWRDWLTGVPASKTYELFTGQPGHTYSFRCRATDNAGNTGNYPATADTSIMVDPTARPPTPWWNSAYSGKRNLTILNNMPGTTLPAGYPVHLHFDASTTPTAAELYNASLSSPKCNDLRVVYNDATELDRVVQNCSSSAIDLWFRTQVSIPGGASNNTAHQLYYGNAGAGAPPANPNQVWYPYREGDTTYLYFFQEGSGSTAYDSSGNGRNCSVDGSVQWAASKFGNGLRFNRANFGDSRSLNCGSAIALSSFTIEFWYKPDADDGGRIAGELAGGGNGGGGNNWLLQNDAGQIRLDVWPCPSCGSSGVKSDFNLRNAPYAGKWNHVAVTFNGGNEVKFYVNGSLNSTKYLSQNGVNTYTPPLEIGSAEGIGQLKGNLGAFRISSGVKTSFPYGAFAAITNEPTTAAGNPVDPPVTGSPDLTLLSLNTYPNPGGGTLVEAVVQNQGNLDTQNGFYTDLYINHLPTAPGDYTGSIQFWVNDPIAAGATVTLTTIITDLAGIGGLSASDELSAMAETSATLYSQVDSTGAVGEPDDSNNIYSAGVEICTASADAYESDDDTSTPNLLPLGTPQTHNFHALADEDWFKIQATAGTTYTISTSDLGISADTYLYLYDTDGSTLLAANDDFSGTLASQIEWAAPATGVYYVAAKHWNPNEGGCGTSYTISFSEKTQSGSGNITYLPVIVKNQ